MRFAQCIAWTTLVLQIGGVAGATPPKFVYCTLGTGYHPEHYWIHAHYDSVQQPAPTLAWRQLPKGQWQLFPTQWRKLQFHHQQRWLIEVQLPLQSGSHHYQLELRQPGQKPYGFRLRSLPSQGQVMKFSDGGDTGIGPEVETIFRQTARLDPDFCVMGGDYAYEGGDPRLWPRFDRWLELWTRNMKRSDGSLIPQLPVLGNHEVVGHFDARPDGAPFWVHYFNRGRTQSYDFRMLPNGLGIWNLDSGHLQSVGGPQKDWLESTLQANSKLDFKLATYHVPLYPSHRKFEDRRSRVLREHWLPLFDRFGLELALEHHDHAHKRTRLLKGGREHAQGTLYLGDGCWGQQPRSVDRKRAYLARADNRRHFWFLVSHPGRLRASAIDAHGRVFDEVDIRPKSQARGGAISSQQQPSSAQSGSR